MSEYLDKINKMRWSYSRATTFEQCKYSFYLNYLLDEEDRDTYPIESNYYADVGIFMHEILAKVYEGEFSMSDAYVYFREHYRENLTSFVKPETMERKYETCCNFLADEDYSWLDKYEILGVEMGYDRHLALAVHVFLVDEAACKDPGAVHLGRSRHRALEGDVGKIPSPVCHVVAAAAGLGRDLVDLVGVGRLAQQVEVRLCEPNGAALLESVVRLGSHAAIDGHRVGREVVAVVHEGIEQAASGSQQHDEHEDAPRYGQAGQAGAQLVAADRFPDFYEQVVHLVT